MSALRRRYGCRRRPIDQPTLVDSRCEPDNVRLNQREGVCVCVCMYSTSLFGPYRCVYVVHWKSVSFVEAESRCSHGRHRFGLEHYL